MTRQLALVAGLLLLAACSSDDLPAAPADGIERIERIEPPFWWTGFEHNELQLLVRGKGIAAYTPTVDARGVSVSRVERGDSPN